MAAVLAFSINTGHLALHEERRPAVAALQAADRLVERAVAVVELAALDVAFGPVDQISGAHAIDAMHYGLSKS